MLQTLSTRKAAYDALSLSIDWLSRTLTAAIPGHEREWAQEVSYALANIEKGLRQRMAVAAAPDGPLAAVDDTRPTLVRQAALLKRGQGGLLEQCLSLQEEVKRAASVFAPASDTFDETIVSAQPADAVAIPDFGAIRQQAERLLAGLEKMKEAEA